MDLNVGIQPLLFHNIAGASYTAGPQDAGMGEGWWAGIVFSQSHLGLVCIWQSSGVCSSRLIIIV